MNYFDTCQTANECKAIYRTLFAENCKDAGTMAEINNQLKDTLAALQHFEQVQAQVAVIAETTTPAIPETTADGKIQEIQNAAKFARSLQGITVEICGSWVWANGNTKAVHKELKSYGFKYAPKKQNWYFNNTPGHRGKRTFPMDQIRMKYGSEATEQPLF